MAALELFKAQVMQLKEQHLRQERDKSEQKILTERLENRINLKSDEVEQLRIENLALKAMLQSRFENLGGTILIINITHSTVKPLQLDCHYPVYLKTLTLKESRTDHGPYQFTVATEVAASSPVSGSRSRRVGHRREPESAFRQRAVQLLRRPAKAIVFRLTWNPYQGLD